MVDVTGEVIDDVFDDVVILVVNAQLITTSSFTIPMWSYRIRPISAISIEFY